MKIRKAAEVVNQMKRDFEVYKDKVDELDSICASHEQLSAILNQENEALLLLFNRVKKYALDDDLKSISSLLEDLDFSR